MYITGLDQQYPLIMVISSDGRHQDPNPLVTKHVEEYQSSHFRQYPGTHGHKKSIHESGDFSSSLTRSFETGPFIDRLGINLVGTSVSVSGPTGA